MRRIAEGLARATARRLLLSRTRRHEPTARPAIVFAPHADDETLGCGGTIALKRAAGATVSVACITDGSTSHDRFLDGAEVARMRAREIIEATRMLGIPEEHVFCLGLTDGKLTHQQEEAIDRIHDLLRAQRPEEVFVPYRFEQPPDHYAANRIVREALSRTGSVVDVFEYPIWFWRQWPWTPLAGSRRDRAAVLRSTLKHGFGLRLWRDIDTTVHIEGVLPQKRAAIAQYRSQMASLEPGWPTLTQVSGGTFLDSFLQPYEFFHRYRASPR